MMALNDDERLLLEAIDSMLKQDAKLGLAFHTQDEELQSIERGLGYLHEQINDMFAVKTAELVHAEGICQAFNKVHCYKYLDDPDFITAMDREMIAQAVPANEREKALRFIPEIISELKAEQSDWAERDFGFNPNLDEIRRISRPKQPDDFKVHSRSINKQNIRNFKRGDGSPARAPARQPPSPRDDDRSSPA